MDPTVELGIGPSRSPRHDRNRAVRPGHIQSQAWKQIRAQGWHPCMRYRKNITFLGAGCRPNTAWIGPRTGTPKAKRRCRRRAGRILDHPHRPCADKVGPSWYALRFWIELGPIKSLGWKWDKTRRTDPARISRHWLVLSVATLGPGLWHQGGRRPRPPDCPRQPEGADPNHRDSRSRPARTVSVMRHGIDWLRRLLLKGRLWTSGGFGGCIHHRLPEN